MIDISPPRSVLEWIGATPDTPPPPRVRLRVYLRNKATCQICQRKLGPTDKWTCDHKEAVINGGENRENNLQTICDWCDRKIKTPADVATKSATYHARSRHVGIKQSRSRPLPFGRNSPLKKKMSGEIVRR